jgi:RNA-directed DNA polymerase
MNERRKSDSSVVPQKPPNTTEGPVAEGVEGRELAKGNRLEENAIQAQNWVHTNAHNALERIREVARGDGKRRFTALFHHIADPARLFEAYYEIKRDAKAGIDGETWQHYGEDLVENLSDLSERLKRGAYRAKPVRRTYIRKADGRLRPLGVPTLEDKIVQRATATVLNAIYEIDFLDFSYGFRAGRSQHDALDALATGMHRRKVNWVLDADIRGFFDQLDHEWVVKFVEHRIADRRVVRLIQKWLNAGVLEDGERTQSEIGTVQGGSISPILANIYLHYAFDLWVRQWRQRLANGDMIVVRYADDFIVGFEHKNDAERFLSELRERLAKFGLELHPEKTRLVPFGRKTATEWREGRGPKPGTFDFLGFTHSCGKGRAGRFLVQRRTMRKRMQAKLAEIKQVLRERMHHSVPEQGAYLRKVVGGYFRYHGVPDNPRAISAFRLGVIRLWHRALSRRSQRSRCNRQRMDRLTARWIPPARVCHPWPMVRFGV